MKTCFFIGHRDAPESIRPAIAAAVENLITEHGVEEFVVGYHGNFDFFSRDAVAALKKTYPQIRLYLLTPYDAPKGFYRQTEAFDSSIYPPGMENVPKRFAIVRANRYMVAHSDYLISFVYQPASNARNLLDYARRLEKAGKLHIIYLFSLIHT